MPEGDSQACLTMNLKPEPCDGCYLWHPYAVCFVCFVISLPILGISVGISDYDDFDCQHDLEGLGLSDWLISFSICLLCYEIYFFADLPSYWSNLYARVCSDKVRVAFYYIFTLALFLWWCTGWYIYAITDGCHNSQLGAISLIVLLVSMVEAMVVGCFCLVTFMVRSYIRADHPSNRPRTYSRDTEPTPTTHLLHRTGGWITSNMAANEYTGDSGTQSNIGLRGRVANMFQEREARSSPGFADEFEEPGQDLIILAMYNELQQMQSQHAAQVRARQRSLREQKRTPKPMNPSSSFDEHYVPNPSPPNQALAITPDNPPSNPNGDVPNYPFPDSEGGIWTQTFELSLFPPRIYTRWLTKKKRDVVGSQNCKLTRTYQTRWPDILTRPDMYIFINAIAGSPKHFDPT